jgi:hypothetical protein
MSSPSPSRNGSDDLDDVFQAMQEDSPARPPRKRAHTMVDSGDDNDGEDTAPIPSGTANPNVAAAVMRFVDRKHLRGEQKTDVQVFLNVSYSFLFLFPASKIYSGILRPCVKGRATPKPFTSRISLPRSSWPLPRGSRLMS